MSGDVPGSATAYGDLPADWTVKPLNEVCSRIVDGTHFTPKYVDFGVPFYSVENVTGANFSDTKYISLEEHQQLIKRCRPEKGDILLTRIGTLGVAKLLDWDVNASIYVSLALLKLEQEVLPAFVYSVTKSAMFRREVERRALVNAAPQKINMDAIGSVPIPIPPTKEEQTAIAQALSDVDDLIVSLDALIAKKRDIKQGAIQQLLTGRRRLPGFTGEWRETVLGNVTKIGTGSRNNQDKDVDGDYPFFVRSQDVERINSYSYDCEAILIPGEGNIGKIYHYIRGKFEAHQRVYVLRDFSEGAEGRYVYLFMRQFFERHALSNTVKATVDSLRRPTFESFPILMPPTKQEQLAIADAIHELEADEDCHARKRAKLDEVREGMMQQLLTGRIRLA